MVEFRNFRSVLDDLQRHAQNLGEHERNSPDVLEKLSQLVVWIWTHISIYGFLQSKFSSLMLMFIFQKDG